MKLLHSLLIVLISLVAITSCNKKTDTATQASRPAEKSESPQSGSTVQGDEKEFVILAKDLNEGAEQNHEMFLKIIQNVTGVPESNYNASARTFIVPVNDKNRNEVSQKIDQLLASSKNNVEATRVAEADVPKTDRNVPFAAQFPADIEKVSIAGISYEDLSKYFSHEELVQYASIEDDDELKENLNREYRARRKK